MKTVNLRFRSEKGQASVEFALVLPLVLIVLLALLQVGVMIVEQLQVSGAAREGARESTVSSDRDRIEQAAERAAPSLRERMSVSIDRDPPTRGLPTTVEVSASPTKLPLVGAIVEERTLKSSATMRIERTA